MQGGAGYALGDRDGESCLESVLHILQPPSLAENSFDPSPMEITSWCGDQDPAFLTPGLEDHDSFLLDHTCTFLSQGHNSGTLNQVSGYHNDSYQSAFMSHVMQLQQLQTNQMQAETTLDQEFYSTAVQQHIPKMKEDREERDPTPTLLPRREPSFFVVKDADHSNLVQCRLDSTSYDAQLDSVQSRGTDPGSEASDFRQHLSSCPDRSSSSSQSNATICELTAMVQHSTSIHRMPPSIFKEQLSIHDMKTGVEISVHEAYAAGAADPGYGCFSLNQQNDSRPDPSSATEVVADAVEQQDHQYIMGLKATMKDYSGHMGNGSAESKRQAPIFDVHAKRQKVSPPLCDPSAEATRFVTSMIPNSCCQDNMAQIFARMDVENSAEVSLQGPRRKGCLVAHVQVDTSGSDLELSTALKAELIAEYIGESGALEAPLNCNWHLGRPPALTGICSQLPSAPSVYSTTVSSEVTKSSDASNINLSQLCPSADTFRRQHTFAMDAINMSSQRPSVHSGWFGFVQHNVQSRLALQCSSSQPTSPQAYNRATNELSVHKVSSHTCASQVTVQELQPRTPEANEFKAAACSWIELCSELVQPVPLAVRIPSKLSELEMARLLQAYKHLSVNKVKEHFPFVREADVYALHPAELISGTGAGQYFFSETKYGSIKKPTRLRITKNGYRWKQQGRTFAIQEGGRTVAFKTYLSYVPLKSSGKGRQGSYPYAYMLGGTDEETDVKSGASDSEQNQQSIVAVKSSMPTTNDTPIQLISEKNEQAAGSSKPATAHRKWALWTMEEIALAEDVEMERSTFKEGGLPRPFPVLCKIGCRTPFEERGYSENIPYAVPIASPALNPLSRPRNRRIRQSFRKVTKKSHYAGMIIAAATGAGAPQAATGTYMFQPLLLSEHAG